MGKVDVSIETKVLSVRLPLPEAARVDARAAACGLSRSDYVRARLLSDQPIANADKIDELVGAIGNHGGAIDRLIRSIDHLTPILQSQGNEEAVKRLEVIAWRLEEICARSLGQAAAQYVAPSPISADAVTTTQH